MRIKKKVLQKVVFVFASVLLLVNSFSPFLLIAPSFINQVKAEEPTITQTQDPTPTDVISPAPTAEPTLVPTETATPTPTSAAEVSTEEAPTVTPTPTVTPEPIPPQAPSQWTFEKVELNKEYIAPQNSEVKLTFTKLPDPTGNIKIEEITLTEDQIKQTGSLSDKAYDITSDMKNGDFSYNLSLPIPESSKGEVVEVKFTEELSNIGSAEKVDNTLTKTDTSVSVSSLDHMTVFVVTAPNPVNSDCSSSGLSVSVGDRCYNTIQAAITAATPGETINVSAGTYNEALTITTANLSIIGDGEDVVTVNVAGKSGGSLQSGISVTAAGVTLQGFTLTSDGAAPSASPRYGIKFSGVNNGSIQHVTVQGLYRSGVDMPSVSGMTIDHVTSQNNGGNGLGLRDISNSTISNITTSGNAWGGVRIQTYNSTISGVVISGTNNFQETAASGVGGLYLEQSNVSALGPPYSITYGTSGSPNVLLQSADFSYAVHGNDNEAPQYSRIWLYKTLDDAKTAAALASGQPSHITDNRYIESLVDDNWYVPSNLGSIQAAIDAASSGDTINVAAGTYTEVGQIVIDKNLSIVGADKATTIIKPAQNTGVGNHLDANSWILVNSGVTFNLSKVTLDGTGKLINHGILSHGHGTIDDNIFTNITYNQSGPDYKGIGIDLYGSDMTVSNNNFSNIGRIGVFTGFGSIAIITGNTYTGKGTGTFLDYGFEVGRNGQATMSNNTISNNKGLASDGSTSAGILVTSYYNPSTPSSATITGNIISNSTDGIAVGYDGSDASVVVAHSNKFSGNTHAISSTHPTVDATNNYWGSANPTFASITSGDVSYNPWWMDSAMTLPSTLIAVFDGIHTTLEGLDIANNIDTCSTHPNDCTNLYFEKSISGVKMGRITFTATLDLTNEATQTFLQNLGTYMEANAGSMKFDATTQAGMKAAGAEIKMYGVDALGYIDGTTPIIVRDDAGNIISEGDTNYPTLSSISYVAGDDGTITFSTNHFTQFDLPDQDQTTPDDGGNATLSDDTPQVVVTDPNLALDLSIADGTDNPTIDVSAFITDGTGTIPKIDINSDDPDNADVQIPATKVTGPADWNGIISAPTIKAVDLPVVSGETKTLGLGIEIGFSDAKLSFDNAVKITLPGQAGKRAGYSRPGTAFTEITTTCGENSQTWADNNLGVDGECKIDVGLDLVIWTKHFTKFAAYTQTTNSTSSSSSTTSGSVSAPVCNDQKPGNAPFGLTAVAGLNSVTLTWNKASDPVSYYLMTFGTSPGSQTYGNPNIGNKDTTSYTVSGLSGGTTYYFKVRAGNGCMPGDFSNEASSSPSGGFIEGVPAGFEAGVLGEATRRVSRRTGRRTNPNNDSHKCRFGQRNTINCKE